MDIDPQGLIAKGMRFYLNPANGDCDWKHPAEVEWPNAIDCTDMADDEFAAALHPYQEGR